MPAGSVQIANPVVCSFADEPEPSGRDRAGRGLAERERAGEHLQQDLRLRVAAHRAEHRGEATVEGR